MKTIKNNMMYFAVALGALIAAPNGHAATAIFNKESGDWNTGTNWSTGAVPGLGDVATVRLFDGMRTAIVDSVVAGTPKLWIGGGNGGQNGTLTITGGSLTTGSAGTSAIGQHSGDNPGTGILNISGGSLTMYDGTTFLFVGYNQATPTADVKGFVNISGSGTFAGAMVLGNSVAGAAGGGTLTVNGNAATIGSTGTSSGILDVRNTGKVVFELGASGVSMLNYAAGGVVFSANSKMTLDLTSYTGGVQAINLIDGNTFTFGGVSGAAGFNAWNNTTNIDWVGEEGYTVALEYYVVPDTTDAFLRLNITAIPEPQTAALLFVSAIGLRLFLRKRKAV